MNPIYNIINEIQLPNMNFNCIYNQSYSLKVFAFKTVGIWTNLFSPYSFKIFHFIIRCIYFVINMLIFFCRSNFLLGSVSLQDPPFLFSINFQNKTWSEKVTSLQINFYQLLIVGPCTMSTFSILSYQNIKCKYIHIYI